MKRIYILLAMAFIGMSFAIITIILGSKPHRSHSAGILQFKPPFDSYVVGAGIVEATTGNIAIGTPVSGIVMEIYVNVGDHVDAGKPLFKIDDRDLQAQLLTASARIKEATASLQKPKQQLERSKELRKLDTNAISEQDFEDLVAETAQAEAAVTLAKAQLSQIQMEIERHTIRALIAGEILQLKMRLGEFVEGGNVSQPLLLLGENKRMNLRVDVDEYDAWRIQPRADAVAIVQGHPELSTPLRYEYTEPYIVPKTSLTGQSAERTDTRVLQVVYSFDPAVLPVYIGQQLDVFIRTLAKNDSGTRL